MQYHLDTLLHVERSQEGTPVYRLILPNLTAMARPVAEGAAETVQVQLESAAQFGVTAAEIIAKDGNVPSEHFVDSEPLTLTFADPQSQP